MREDRTTVGQSSRLTVALVGVIIAGVTAVLFWAFDFRSWVVDEVYSVRTDQIKAMQGVENAMTAVSAEMKNVGREVSEMRDAMVRQADTSTDNARRLGKIEGRLDMIEATRFRREDFDREAGKLAEQIHALELKGGG